jgi:hypothetical protein
VRPRESKTGTASGGEDERGSCPGRETVRHNRAESDTVFASLLQKLDASYLNLRDVPVPVLGALTALTHLSLSYQRSDNDFCEFPSSLVPILQRGLVFLDLEQDRPIRDWMSVLHMGDVIIDLNERTPVPTFTFPPVVI